MLPIRYTLLGAVAVAAMFTACAKKTAVAVPARPPLVTEEPARTAEAKRPVRAEARNVTPAAKPPANATMSPQERTALNESLARLEDALFDYDRSTIRPDALKALEQDVAVIRDTMKKYPSESIRLEGHADQRGSSEYNLALGDRRAVSVKEFLVTSGVPAAQLSTVSYGKERPQCTDDSEACWQKNRRVHLEVASK